MSGLCVCVCVCVISSNLWCWTSWVFLLFYYFLFSKNSHIFWFLHYLLRAVPPNWEAASGATVLCKVPPTPTKKKKKQQKKLATFGLCLFLQSCIISTIIMMECQNWRSFAKWENGNKVILKCNVFYKSIFLNRRFSLIQCHCILFHFSEYALPSKFQAFINIFVEWKPWQLSMFLYFCLL